MLQQLLSEFVECIVKENIKIKFAVWPAVQLDKRCDPQVQTMRRRINRLEREIIATKNIFQNRVQREKEILSILGEYELAHQPINQSIYQSIQYQIPINRFEANESVKSIKGESRECYLSVTGVASDILCKSSLLL